ncbi:FliI/YscN family ATPase [Yoonia sp. SS1-5]|uniref:FliI/YscN family ATPase n=1 Tax=Yoonia rhodophyticola TaxID=3137370 RepID=A0AAN0MFK9_9RHOB
MTLLLDRLEATRAALYGMTPRPPQGRVTRLSGPVIRAVFSHAIIGEICEIHRTAGQPAIIGRVVGLDDNEVIISPFGACTGLAVGAPVRSYGRELTVAVGHQLLGRTLDGMGNPIDGLDPLPPGMMRRPVTCDAPPPMTRPLIERPMITGMKAIDFATTLGRGQRVGIFGSAGTGKSSTLSAIAQHCEADIIVIAMIGERGREVREFLERSLPAEKRRNTVVVAATSDRSPMERLNGAHVATAIAESFRDEGKSVLLMMDSLTRVARALREIGLAAGEAPTRRGYPASVYPALPELIERAGRNVHGDITGLFTVLVEGDDANDPIGEEVRSLTDGHIILDPKIAAEGRYPAINVARSLSRIMGDVTDDTHREMMIEVRRLIAIYERIEILVQIGEYEPGQDKDNDRAVALVPKINEAFKQKIEEKFALEDTFALFKKILSDAK